MNNNYKTIKLETDRLILRRLNKKDVEDVYEIMGDEKTVNYLSGTATKEGTKKYIMKEIDKSANSYGGSYAVVLKNENKVIGIISINIEEKNSKAEIGYLFNSNYWNKGYAIESVKCVVDFIFNKLRLNRIEADCITENEGSLKIFKKLNMSYEGTRRQSRYNKKHDKYFDVCYYGLLREDYLNNN
jgi:RimJ/RimL family protein N-acetyltransferase